MVTREEADEGWDSMTESDYEAMNKNDARDAAQDILIEGRNDEERANAEAAADAHLEGLERQRERDLIEREEMQEEARAEAFRHTQDRDMEDEERSRSMQDQEDRHVQDRRSNEVQENDYLANLQFGNQLREASLEPHEILREASLEPHEILREQRAPFGGNRQVSSFFSGIGRASGGVSSGIDIGMIGKGTGWGAGFKFAKVKKQFGESHHQYKVIPIKSTRAKPNQDNQWDLMSPFQKGMFEDIMPKGGVNKKQLADKTTAIENSFKLFKKDVTMPWIDENVSLKGKGLSHATLKATMERHDNLFGDPKDKAALAAERGRAMQEIVNRKHIYLSKVKAGKEAAATRDAILKMGLKSEQPTVDVPYMSGRDNQDRDPKVSVKQTMKGTFAKAKPTPNQEIQLKQAKIDIAADPNFATKTSQDKEYKARKAKIMKTHFAPPLEKKITNIWSGVDVKNIDPKTKKPIPLMTDFEKELYAIPVDKKILARDAAKRAANKPTGKHIPKDELGLSDSGIPFTSGRRYVAEQVENPGGKLTKDMVKNKVSAFKARMKRFKKEETDPYLKEITRDMQNDPTHTMYASVFPGIHARLETKRVEAQETVRNAEVRLFNKMSIKERNYWGNVAPEGFNVRERDAMFAQVAQKKTQWGQDALWNSLPSHEQVGYYGGVQPGVITKKDLTEHRKKRSEKLTYEKNQLKMWDSLASHEQVGFYGGVQPLSITSADLAGHRTKRAARLKVQTDKLGAWNALAKEEKHYFYGGVQPDHLITTAEITDRRTKSKALDKQVQKESTDLITKRAGDAALEVQRIETKRKNASPFDMFMAWGRGDKELAGLATKNAKAAAANKLRQYNADLQQGIADRKAAQDAKRSWFYGGGLSPTAPTKEHPQGRFPTTSGQPRRNPSPLRHSELNFFGTPFGMKKPLKGKWSKRKGKIVITAAERKRARKAKSKAPRGFLDDVFGGF